MIYLCLEEMERLRAEELRLRESATYADWQEKEDEFHLKQHAERSKIRLVDGSRKKAIFLDKIQFLIIS